MVARQSVCFKGTILVEAIRLTLGHRGTELPHDIKIFSTPFIETKHVQWNTFRKKLNQDHIPHDFEEIVLLIKEFLGPMASGLHSEITVPVKWRAPGPWM